MQAIKIIFLVRKVKNSTRKNTKGTGCSIFADEFSLKNNRVFKYVYKICISRNGFRPEHWIAKSNVKTLDGYQSHVPIPDCTPKCKWISKWIPRLEHMKRCKKYVRYKKHIFTIQPHCHKPKHNKLIEAVAIFKRLIQNHPKSVANRMYQYIYISNVCVLSIYIFPMYMFCQYIYIANVYTII